MHLRVFLDGTNKKWDKYELKILEDGAVQYAKIKLICFFKFFSYYSVANGT